MAAYRSHATLCLKVYEFDPLSQPQQSPLESLGLESLSCQLSAKLSGSLAALRVCTKSACHSLESEDQVIGGRISMAMVLSPLPSLRSRPGTLRFSYSQAYVSIFTTIGPRDCVSPQSLGPVASSLGRGGVLGLFLKLAGVLLVFLTDLVELPHVLEEVGASLESDEKLGLLAIASIV